MLVRPPLGVVQHLLLHVEDLDLTVRPDPVGDVQRVIAGARADLEHTLARLRGEDLAQPVPRDDRVRRLHPEALVVGARRRVLAPPQSRSSDRRRGRQEQPFEGPHPLNPTVCAGVSVRTNTTWVRSSETVPPDVS